MTAVKICCIASLEEAELAIAAGAAAIGLVGPMPSGPGAIPDARSAQIAQAVRGRAMSVLLTCETAPDAVVAHVARCRPSAVQLVDTPQPGTIAALRTAFAGLTIIQVIHIGGPSAVADAKAAAAAVDMLLLDSGAPEMAVKELGGTGRVHDWSISAQIVRDSACPVWLAGGLSPDNAAAAISAVAPHGLDICTGLRPEGRLDPRLLSAFMALAR
ncbi:MAG: phosphoribosylanthranilate isomerase [Pseudomonadota bacterium]